MSNQQSDPVECVGSLLIHTRDVQELSEHAVQPELPEVNLQKRVTVGTLLVNQNDLDSHSSSSGGGEKPNVATTGEETNDASPSIVRRITKVLQGPAPDDAEADTWAD